MKGIVRIKLILILAVCLFGGFFFLKNPLALYVQAQTQKKSVFDNWLPNREIPGVNFVGSETCISCHKEEGHTHSAMSQALVKPADSDFWNDFPSAGFQNGEYSYKLTKQGTDLIYTVSDGTKEISEQILYGFGEGRAGQVYVFRHNGELYESRVTYYRALKNLDFTVAQTHDKPTSLEDALGRVIPANEVQSCFSCHSTAAVRNRKLELATMQLGVNCEACHGPGENHLAAVKAKDKDLQIFNPSNLNALDLSQEFCGSCHVGFDKVLDLPSGVVTVRFEPYRLFYSKAHNPNDERLSCVACHNPHEKIVNDSKAYDIKCLACHLPSDNTPKQSFQTAPACPVKSENCVSCHMPKTDVPEMHFKYTDHLIRTVRANEKIPQ